MMRRQNLAFACKPVEVPLVSGETYYIDVLDTGNFTPYTQPSWNLYDDGTAYRDGATTPYDLAMTIIQSSAAAQVPEPSALAMLAAGAATLFALARRRKSK